MKGRRWRRKERPIEGISVAYMRQILGYVVTAAVLSPTHIGFVFCSPKDRRNWSWPLVLKKAAERAYRADYLDPINDPARGDDELDLLLLIQVLLEWQLGPEFRSCPQKLWRAMEAGVLDAMKALPRNAPRRRAKGEEKAA